MKLARLGSNTARLDESPVDGQRQKKIENQSKALVEMPAI
jgi:hypothetical protein